MSTMLISRTWEGQKVQAVAEYVGGVVTELRFRDAPDCFDPAPGLVDFMRREATAELLEVLHD